MPSSRKLRTTEGAGMILKSDPELMHSRRTKEPWEYSWKLLARDKEIKKTAEVS
jgi:hypothetical protein